MNYQKIYCSIEIRENKLMVLVGCYRESKIIILFKKEWTSKSYKKESHYFIKEFGKKLRQIISEASNHLGVNIKKIILVVPDKELIIRKTHEYVSFENAKMIDQNVVSYLHSKASTKNTHQDEKNCFLKPYEYIMNGEYIVPNIPIQSYATQLELKALIYNMHHSFYKLHEQIINYAGLEIMSSIPKSIGTAFYLVKPVEFKTGINLVILEENNISINIFVKDVLCKTFTYNFGINSIIDKIQNRFKCKWKMAKQYLEKFANIQKNNSSNIIIYSKYHSTNNYYEKETEAQFNNFINMEIKLLIQKISTKIQQLTGERSFTTFYTGLINSITGIDSVLKKSDIKVIRPPSLILGNFSPLISNLLGAIHFHYVEDNLSGKMRLSTDKLFAGRELSKAQFNNSQFNNQRPPTNNVINNNHNVNTAYWKHTQQNLTNFQKIIKK